MSSVFAIIPVVIADCVGCYMYNIYMVYKSITLKWEYLSDIHIMHKIL